MALDWNDSSQGEIDASDGVKADTAQTKKLAYSPEHVLVWIFSNSFLRKREIGSKGSGAASKLLPKHQGSRCSCIVLTGGKQSDAALQVTNVYLMNVIS